MSESSSQPHGVMEGGGAYNRYAKPQAQGIESALSLLEQVVRDTTIDDGNDPVVMADYGSSQGSITADTRARMVLGSYPRGRRELLAPFAWRCLRVERAMGIEPTEKALPRLDNKRSRANANAKGD
jgi:hypothetical protein